MPATSFTESIIPRKLDHSDDAIPNATPDTYGSEVSAFPLIENLNLSVIDYLVLESHGVSSETLTIRITVTYTNGSTDQSQTKVFTTNTTQTLSDAELFILNPNKIHIKSITIASKSSKASSTAFGHIGISGH